MIDNDWDILIKKLDSLEEKIDRLEKMLGIVKQPSYPVPNILPNDSSKVKPMTSEDWYKVLQNTPCAFDSIPLEDRMKPTGLSCNCPKCTPYSMSLQDAVSRQRVPARELFKDLVPVDVEVDVLAAPMQWGCTDDTITPEKLLGETK